MIVVTHKKIANTVFDQFTGDIQSRLNRKKFVAGSLHPDLNVKLSAKEHSYEETEAFFKKTVSRIISGNLSKSSLSHKLGIVCHYLSDYCCTYHTNTVCRKKSVAEHLLYEFRLDRKFSSVMKSWKDTAFFDLLPGGFDHQPEEMVRGREDQPADIERDILHAVTISYFYLVSLISAALSKAEAGDHSFCA